MLTLRTLILFHELGSLTEAAERVGRTQAAASLQLRRLEAQVGCSLFEKKGRRLHLNESGLGLLKYAKQIIQLNDEALNNVRTQLSGKVTLGISQDLAEEWLLPVLNQFKMKHPGVQVHVRVDRNYMLEKAARDEELDLAILASRNPMAKALGSIRSPMVWISANGIESRNHPLQLVLFDNPCLFHSEAIRNLKKAQIPFEIAFTSSSLAAVWSAVRAGLGVTLRSSVGLPKDLIASERISRRAEKLGSIHFSLVKIKRMQDPVVQSLQENLVQALLR